MNWKGLQNPKALNQIDGTLSSNKLASIQTQTNVLWKCDEDKKDLSCIVTKCPVFTQRDL